MDISELKSATQPKPHAVPMAAWTNKSGKQVKVPFVKAMPVEEALRVAKSGASVLARTAAYMTIVCDCIKSHPAEMKAGAQGEAAKPIFEKLEESVFGKDQPTDPTWRTVKSAYGRYYAKYGNVDIERDGESWLAPLRYVATRLRKPPERKDADTKFIAGIKGALEGGVSTKACEEAMQLIASYHDARVKAEAEGKIEGEGEEEGELVEGFTFDQSEAQEEPQQAQ